MIREEEQEGAQVGISSHITTIISPTEKTVGGFYLGDIQALTNNETLRKHRIRAVVSVIDTDVKVPEGISHMQIRITDSPEQNVEQYFRQVFEFISLKRRECNVLVHCLAGLSRSPTFVIGYLMVSRQISLDRAFDIVHEQRPSIRPNEGFIKQLRGLDNQIKKFVQTRRNIKNQMKGLFD